VRLSKGKTLIPEKLSKSLKINFYKITKVAVFSPHKHMNNKITQKKQDEALATYTRKFTKADGFIPWEEFVKSLKIENCKLRIERAARALYPWPGVWTKMPASTRVRSSTRGRPNNKSLKLLPKNLVQLEGKSPITLKQFLAGYQHLLK